MFDFADIHETKQLQSKNNGTVIFFHGSGSNGQEMQLWVNIFLKLAFPHLKIIYPTAPLQPYTPRDGFDSNVWFNRNAITQNVPENVESVNKMKSLVSKLIKQENDSGVPTERIIVGGFSMGGALAFHVGYRWARSVAGVFAFSSFLNDDSVVYDELAKLSNAKLPPLLQIHGEGDDLVDIKWGENTFRRLKSLGVDGTFISIPKLDHQINKRGMLKIKEFIEMLLPETEHSIDNNAKSPTSSL